MLTTGERDFYDVWFREDCGYPSTYATPISHARGIDYNHYARLYPFYVETWKAIGEWTDSFPPAPQNPTPPCPWPSREAMEARLEELETGPLSHLTYQAMRDWMLKNPLPQLTTVISQADEELEPQERP